jgi:sporulation protein YlmC with PRC-barrel domain
MSVQVLKLSRLLELPVEDENGRPLGRIHDVRVKRTSDAYEVAGLIIGPRGTLVRLGWRRARGPAPLAPQDAVPWDRVVAIESERIVVRG